MIEVLSDEAIKRMGESMKEEIISEEIQQEEKQMSKSINTSPMIEQYMFPCRDCLKEDVCGYKQQVEEMVKRVNKTISDIITDNNTFGFYIECKRYVKAQPQIVER